MAPDAVAEKVEHPLAEVANDRCDPVQVQTMLGATCQELRSQVSHCHEAAALVQCWEEGVTERRAVQDRTDLTDAAYDRARKRLFYASHNLSSELRESAQNLLRSAS